MGQKFAIDSFEDFNERKTPSEEMWMPKVMNKKAKVVETSSAMK